MDRHPDDVTAADDLQLVQAARTGDRLAFGVLYLRHHAAAWRIGCVASRFSPDAELAVIEGFTRVFSALPEQSEDLQAGRVSFRPYLLACVRQAALDRARAAGRAERATNLARRRPSRPESPPVPATLTGLTPEGEVVLASLEHHVARGALAALPERSRTALWLTDVEAMTPGEAAGIVGGGPQEVADLAARARAEVRAGREAALGRHEVRSDCRFTVGNLDTFAAGTLDPAKGVLVRSHLDICPPCRMRLAELANAPAALAAAVPAAPLLGGETQHHWLDSIDAIRPAERLLPPGVAAAAPAHRLPDVLRRAGRAATRSWLLDAQPIDLTTSPEASSRPGWTAAPGWAPSPSPARPPAWTVPPRRTAPRSAAPAPRRRDRRRERFSMLASTVPVAGRRAGRAVWPAVPVTVLMIAWLGVMVSLPHLMSPSTAPAPDTLALPAVQAYVPGYLPGAARPSAARAAAAPSAGAAAPSASQNRVDTGEGGSLAGGTEVAAPAAGAAERASAGSTGPTAGGAAPVTLIRTTAARSSGPGSGPGADSLAAEPTPVAQAATATAPLAVAAAPVAPTTVTVDSAPAGAAKPGKGIKGYRPAKPRPDAELRPEAKPGKEPRERVGKRKPERSIERQDPRARQDPARRDRIVTA